MRIVNVKQGSDEWREARLGIPTASCFDKIITPKKAELSSQSDGYMHRLIAEWFFGDVADDAEASQFMERGKELEPEAANWYALAYGVDPIEVGLCLTDDGRAGASPDRLIQPNAGLEIKCPSAPVHVGYLLNGVDGEYKTQVQGQMWVCELEWVDRVFYHPVLERIVVRTERDDGYIKKLAAAVTAFCDRLDEAKARFAAAKAEYDEQRAEAAAAELEALAPPAGIC